MTDKLKQIEDALQEAIILDDDSYDSDAKERGYQALKTLRDLQETHMLVEGWRDIDEWYEDDGEAIWAKFPIEEPFYAGSPLCSDWQPNYYTHFILMGDICKTQSTINLQESHENGGDDDR